MATLLLRNLEDSVKAHLQHRAERHGRSMEEEACAILTTTLSEQQKNVEEDANQVGMGTEIVALFRGIGFDEEIPEIRCQSRHAGTPGGN